MNVKHEYKGFKGLVAIAKHVGLCPSTLSYRLKQGMSLVQAVETPARLGGARVRNAKYVGVKKPDLMSPFWALALGVKL